MASDGLSIQDLDRTALPLHTNYILVCTKHNSGILMIDKTRLSEEVISGTDFHKSAKERAQHAFTAEIYANCKALAQSFLASMFLQLSSTNNNTISTLLYCELNSILHAVSELVAKAIAHNTTLVAVVHNCSMEVSATVLNTRSLQP